MEERENDLIKENLTIRKGDLDEGQSLSDVRQGVENDFDVHNQADPFLIIQRLEHELPKAFSHEPKVEPATTSAWNIVRDHASKTQGKEVSRKHPPHLESPKGGEAE